MIPSKLSCGGHTEMLPFLQDLEIASDSWLPAQYLDKLKALRKKYEEVMDKQRRHGTGIESDEDSTLADCKLFTQLHSVLQSRVVIGNWHSRQLEQ